MANLINFNDAPKKHDIHSDNNSDENDNDFKIVNLKLHFEKNYYDKIMKICHNDNMTLGDILNEALGMYVELNYIDEDEHQKNMNKMWKNFNDKHKK